MRYSIPLRVRVEADLPAAIIAAAEKARLKQAEWMRQKLREAVLADGIVLTPNGGDGDEPSPVQPAPAQRLAA